MASTVLYMPVSLDGFIAGPNESWGDNPLGDDGRYLHGWFPAGVTPGDARPPSDDINSQIFDELNATGAKQAAGDKEVSVHGAASESSQVEHGVTHLRYRVRHGA